ncbi:MAG TPA: bifunctional alpha,alpha-trehalose-phosphate synthase (UDP-forming)/trehalose-phosphatase [bacterium]|nr:bifunctional alpha,alpha-trehalose-phosphate synthase (UDP-forming)/trehalose-phosphatase [bacterium]HPG44763.1 bifunctional alpha,alpha-trehalose-phosphate synthase (UDP-forming)/trehalose-phosphatase [bacterium]HPM99065.1 bifunctional alpha,alpha-trehalose-phosphate synthase (UDP-forming)/trehalose-phosphatase [bacterium]
MQKRMWIISNRLPVHISKRQGEFIYTKSAGGLATGLSSFYKTHASQWIGWSGYLTESSADKERIAAALEKESAFPVFLSRREIENYYEGFSNKTIWPLFHYFLEQVIYDKRYWETYRRVNQRFCDRILKVAKPDEHIWIHDYHLMLLPAMLREKNPQLKIGFFLHIPFPSFEVFRTLPWRSELMQGMLGADLIGFHTHDYARHFLSAASRLLGLEHVLMRLTYEDRIVKVDSFPMGIDFAKFEQAPEKPATEREISRIQYRLGGQKLILSIDRLDYSKGILQRLEAFHLFLQQHPEYREKVTLLLLVVPSRSRVESYRQLKLKVDSIVGRINGEHATIGWTPIWYLYRSAPFHTLSAMYHLADVALITPFRDGMNLVAKEFVASKTNRRGVLILSEMAGAAAELGEALLINPFNIDEIAAALAKALEMAGEEQSRRLQEMQSKIKRYDVTRWAQDFVDGLQQVSEQNAGLRSNLMTSEDEKKIVDRFRRSKNPTLFLDYDGTLVPFARTPAQARPPQGLLDLLCRLGAQTRLVLISGRRKQDLDEWFADLPLELSAEHGAWIKRKGEDWTTIEPLTGEWKSDILPILEATVARTPGSFVEDKDYSLVWHYRKADVGLGQIRARELTNELLYMTANLNLQVMEGDKIIEIKNAGINKGRSALFFLAQAVETDFILAAGDDYTDEFLFKVLPPAATTIKVGFRMTEARYNVKSHQQVRQLLEKMSL